MYKALKFLSINILMLFFVIAANAAPSNKQSSEDSTIVTSVAKAESVPLPDTNAKQGVVSSGKKMLLNQQRGFTFNPLTLLRGVLGILVLFGICFLFSSNRKAIAWKTIGIAFSLQLLLAISVLYFYPVQIFFEYAGKLFIVILDFTKEGSRFLLGSILDTSKFGFIFAFQILPTIIFFSALTSLLFYLGIIQKVVWLMAWIMTKALRLSGAESLAVAGNVFLGQTEAPLMIKAYIPTMTKSELMLVMTGGMATLAGGVLASYIDFLGDGDPAQRLLFAKHLITASVMAAPGAVIASKLLFPQTKAISTVVEVSKEKIGRNVLDAISNGGAEGLKLAANVAAMLLVFVAFIAMLNYILFKVGDWTSLNASIASVSGGGYKGLSLQFILGYVFAPVMWLIGVCWEDATLVGRLLGEKLILTEFIGYISLEKLMSANAFLQTKSILMATYMLAGFANFASIGIQIGGIGSIAPNQKPQLAAFGMRALLGGTVASLIPATIVGVLLT